MLTKSPTGRIDVKRPKMNVRNFEVSTLSSKDRTTYCRACPVPSWMLMQLPTPPSVKHHQRHPRDPSRRDKHKSNHQRPLLKKPSIMTWISWKCSAGMVPNSWRLYTLRTHCAGPTSLTLRFSASILYKSLQALARSYSLSLRTTSCSLVKGGEALKPCRSIRTNLTSLLPYLSVLELSCRYSLVQISSWSAKPMCDLIVWSSVR